MPEPNRQSPTTHFVKAVELIEASESHLALPDHMTPDATQTLPAPDDQVDIHSAEVDLRQELQAPHQIGSRIVSAATERRRLTPLPPDETTLQMRAESEERRKAFFETETGKSLQANIGFLEEVRTAITAEVLSDTHLSLDSVSPANLGQVPKTLSQRYKDRLDSEGIPFNFAALEAGDANHGQGARYKLLEYRGRLQKVVDVLLQRPDLQPEQANVINIPIPATGGTDTGWRLHPTVYMRGQLAAYKTYDPTKEPEQRFITIDELVEANPKPL